MKMPWITSLAALIGLPVVLGLAIPPTARGSGTIQSESAIETLSADDLHNFVADNCVMCHNDAALTGGLSLESFDAAHPEQDAEVAEKMIHKLHAGMMPPSYSLQPEPEMVEAFVTTVETRIDAAAAANPNPGRRTFQRLNRAEYRRSVRELLEIDVDVEALLPPDTISHSFDNIADVQGMSATVMDAYLRAGDHVSRLAVGDPEANPGEVTYKVPRTASQRRHVEGAPFGTRGGIAVEHTFPADGDYVFKIQLHATIDGYLFGRTAPEEQIEVSIDGRRVALLDIDPMMSETDPNGMNMQTESISVKAGTHRVSAAFLKKTETVIEDLLVPIEHTLADSEIGRDYGITTVPHLRDLSISGPHRVTGVSDTAARRKIFSCRPTASDEELDCAEEIVGSLATEAYRRPVQETEVESLMSFYAIGREEGDFEDGVRMALQSILTSPSFLLRLERVPETASVGDVYELDDVELASRLAFFLWSSPPDDELIELAARGELTADDDTLHEQVRRMLRDPRAATLATRFGSLWLRLQDLEKLHPDALTYPLYDATLAESMKRETELFFEHLIREDKSLLELLTADYTFVDERLAQHYGIPNVTGSAFRKVALEGVNAKRRGVLGHGSILALTSIANRTSPVLRGKWVMEVLLGSPPPPPPPNVPALEDTNAVAGDRVLTVRERMESHRANPACNSCHAVIDPIGLALENFDVTGAWRVKDGGAHIDASGELYDGTRLDGPIGLRDALLTHSEAFIRTFTKSMMTFALGRRVEYPDMPTVRAIVGRAQENDYRISSFIYGIVDSPAFRMNVIEPAGAVTTDAPAPHP